MNSLFDLIVRIFQGICAVTGLRYAELNILVYCLLIPFSWAIIIAFRNRNYFILPVLHIISIYLYLSFRGELNIKSRQLYDINVKWLEYFGENTPQGYIYISLFIGVLVPIVMYGLLLFVPKQKVIWIYFLFMAVLFGYQFLIVSNILK